MKAGQACGQQRPKPAPEDEPPAKPTKAAKRGRPRTSVVQADPALFDPLTPGEIADAIRTLSEDRRVAQMAKVGAAIA